MCFLILAAILQRCADHLNYSAPCETVSLTAGRKKPRFDPEVVFPNAVVSIEKSNSWIGYSEVGSYLRLTPPLSLALIGSCSVHPVGVRSYLRVRGAFDNETRGKPLAIAAGVLSVSLYMEFEWQFRRLFA